MTAAVLLLLSAAAFAAAEPGIYNSDLMYGSSATATEPALLVPTESVIDVAIIIDGTDMMTTSGYGAAPAPVGAQPAVLSAPEAQPVDQMSVPLQQPVAAASLLSPPQTPLGGPATPSSGGSVTANADSATGAVSGAAPGSAVAAPKPIPIIAEAPQPAPASIEKVYKGEGNVVSAPRAISSPGSESYQGSTDSVTNNAPKPAPAPSGDYSTKTVQETAFPRNDAGFQRAGEYDASKQSPFQADGGYATAKVSASNYTVSPPAPGSTYAPGSQPQFVTGGYQVPKTAAKSSSASVAAASTGAVTLLLTLLLFAVI